MQFAFPPRKTSNPPPYSRPSRSTIQRRNELRTTAVLGCAIVSILFLVYYMSASNAPAVAGGSGTLEKSKVVIVTVVDDETYGSEYIQRMKENREDYAKRHGNESFYPLALSLVLTLNSSTKLKDTSTSSLMSRATSHTSTTTPNPGLWSPPSAMRWPNTPQAPTSSTSPNTP